LEKHDSCRLFLKADRETLLQALLSIANPDPDGCCQCLYCHALDWGGYCGNAASNKVCNNE